MASKIDPQYGKNELSVAPSLDASYFDFGSLAGIQSEREELIYIRSSVEITVFRVVAKSVRDGIGKLVRARNLLSCRVYFIKNTVASSEIDHPIQ